MKRHKAPGLSGLVTEMIHATGDIGTQWPSVLRRCWLGDRKGIRPVEKLEWWGAGMVICLERGADLNMAQLMLLPLTVSCFSKILIAFTFLVPAHPGSLGKSAIKRMCVWILDLCNSIVKEGSIPEDWKSSVVLPIYKGKGDPMECGSYRGIKMLEKCYESRRKDF